MRKVFLKFYKVYCGIKVKFMSDDAIIAAVRKDMRKALDRESERLM